MFAVLKVTPTTVMMIHMCTYDNFLQITNYKSNNATYGKCNEH